MNTKTQIQIAPNKSKTYLLPLISEFVDLNPEFYGNIVNTYLFDESGEYENCIFVEMDFNFKIPEFTAFEHTLKESENFLKLYDISDEKVLYIFKFPEDYLNEYNAYKNGKYSEFGEDAQELIFDFFRGVYDNKKEVIPFLLKLKQIFGKDEVLREELEKQLKVKISPDAEVSAIMDIKKETINLD